MSSTVRNRPPSGSRPSLVRTLMNRPSLIEFMRRLEESTGG